MVIDSTQTGTSGTFTFAHASIYYHIKRRHPLHPPEFTKRMLSALLLIAMFGVPAWGIYVLETLK